MQIIGFIGKKNSGKTTACNIIRGLVGGVIQHNFKDALVAELRENFPGLLGEMCRVYDVAMPYKDGHLWTVDDLFKEKPPLMRFLMQEYGTEVRRGDRDDYWVAQWVNGLPPIGGGFVLVDDVRFRNEAAAVKSRGGILIRLVRKDIRGTDKHQSEVEQDSIQADYTIESGWGEEALLESELIKILDI